MHLSPASLQTLAQWAQILGNLGQALTGLVILGGGITLAFNFAAHRRADMQFKQEQERRRISRRQMKFSLHAVMTTANRVPTFAGLPHPASSEGATGPVRRPVQSPQNDELSQFLIARVALDNMGDAPVDMLACLLSARELSGGDHKESWGGNIQWNDLDPYYFDTAVPEWEHLAGISNTRHIVYSQDDYLSLDPHDETVQTRIDRIDPLARTTTLLYRLFAVGRGFASDRPIFAQRDLIAWGRLQQALFNISGPSFRILFNEPDPLDRVADYDGFQCFLLYHMAFTDDNRDQIGWTNIDWLNSLLEGDWGQQHDYPAALQLVQEKLGPYKDRWQRHWAAFQQAIAKCKQLSDGFAGLIKLDWRPQIPGEQAGHAKDDLTALTAKEAFLRLPPYLRGSSTDPDALAIWQRFFVVSLKPSSDE